MSRFFLYLRVIVVVAFLATMHDMRAQETGMTLEEAQLEALEGTPVRDSAGELQKHTIDNPGTGRQKVFRGKYHTVSEEGDTVLVLIFNDITVFPEFKFKNKKQRDFYWRTVRDVKKTLPYAKLICETLLETYEYIETFPTQAEREKYLKEMESAVFKQYKPVLMRFTKNQARMLVKLIQRETNQSGYDILKAFLGSFRATFWQGFGSLFGVNLKGKYNPEKDSKDAIIERICVAVEQGEI